MSKPRSIYEDAKVYQAGASIISRALKYQPSPVFAFSDLIALVFLGASNVGLFNAGTPALNTMLARAIRSLLSFKNDEGVVNFCGELAAEIIRQRKHDSRLFGIGAGKA